MIMRIIKAVILLPFFIIGNCLTGIILILGGIYEDITSTLAGGTYEVWKNRSMGISTRN